MKRSQISSSRTCPQLTITVFGVFLFFLIGFTLTPRRLSDSSVGSSRNLAGKFDFPRFAYFVTGTKGDVTRVKRLLKAIYHPRNYYLLHLDLEASDDERLELAKYVRSEKMIDRKLRNVMVMGMADLVTEKGPTTMANTLHGIAILLKKARDWDWFVNLSASDYPLMPQDDILHIFSYLPRYLNFIEHTSNMGWKENQRARAIIIDPVLYHSVKSGVFWATERRIDKCSSNKIIHGVLHLGMGQSTQNRLDVLHQLPLLPRRLFPHCHLQQQRLSEHNRQPRPALHTLGQPSEPAAAQSNR